MHIRLGHPQPLATRSADSRGSARVISTEMGVRGLHFLLICSTLGLPFFRVRNRQVNTS